MRPLSNKHWVIFKDLWSEQSAPLKGNCPIAQSDGSAPMDLVCAAMLAVIPTAP